MKDGGPEREDSQRRIEDRTRIMLRPLASPLPLGFFAFGIFQITLSLTLLLLGVVGLQGKPLISAVILFATIHYSFNGLYEFTTQSWMALVSAITECVIFLFALYGGLALALEDAKHRPVLPFGRRGEALEAVEGDLGDQVGPIEKEAGVRKQL